ncbi:MAG: CinA family protein [bacterium]|nr:MAG: CinA family protein [bacterium]
MTTYHKLIELLKQNKLTISTADSCTGGLISKLITDVPGASEVFIGGVVSYSNEMKVRWLGVKQETLEQHGAVSENTVKEMLNGIMRQSGSDIAVAVSGIAGPTGGTPEKPVGTVFLGVLFRDQMMVKKYLFKGSRQEVRLKSAKKAEEMIHNLLDNIKII